jgi:hypothetical protein
MQFPVSRRRHRSLAPEGIREMALVGKPSLDGNLGESQLRNGKQLSRMPDSASADIF